MFSSDMFGDSGDVPSTNGNEIQNFDDFPNPDDYSAFLDDDLLMHENETNDSVEGLRLGARKNFLSRMREKSTARQKHGFASSDSTSSFQKSSSDSSKGGTVGGEVWSGSLSISGIESGLFDQLALDNHDGSNSIAIDNNEEYDGRVHNDVFDFDGGVSLDHVNLDLNVAETSSEDPADLTQIVRRRKRPRYHPGYKTERSNNSACSDEPEKNRIKDVGDDSDDQAKKLGGRIVNGFGNVLMGTLTAEDKKGRKKRKSNDVPTDETPKQTELRMEYTRQRNREHARATRRRKKMYVECLKSQVADLLHKQQLMNSGAYGDLLESSGGTAAQIATIRKAVIQTFLQYRTKDMLEQSRWRDLVETSFVLIQPRTPFRGENIGGIVGNNRRCQGVQCLIQDTSSIAAMLDMISGRVCAQKPKLPAKHCRIGLNYTVDSSDILLVGERLMCHWTLSTSGLLRAGFDSECIVDGMLKCSFNTRHKLLEMEITYDAMAFTRQMQQHSLIDLSVIFQHSLRGPISRSKKMPSKGDTISIRETNGRLPMRAMVPFPPLCMPNKQGDVSQSKKTAKGTSTLRNGMVGVPMMGMVPPHLMLGVSGVLPAMNIGPAAAGQTKKTVPSNISSSRNTLPNGDMNESMTVVAGLKIPNGMRLQLPFTKKQPPTVGGIVHTSLAQESTSENSSSDSSTDNGASKDSNTASLEKQL